MTKIGKIYQGSAKIRLDIKDRKILSLLMLDARMSLSDISKKVELSKSNIARRISKMEESRLITGYHAFIDVTKLKVNSTLILLKTRATHTEKEEYLSRLADMDEVYSLVEIIGEFDIALGIYSINKEEKNIILDNIFDEKFMKDFEICEIKTLFPHMNYTGEMFKDIKQKETIQIKNYEIDKKDLKILSALSKNCRISSVDLAENLKLPMGTINYRIKKLIGSKIISKFQPTVNFFMLDTEFYFLRFKLSKPSDKENLKEYLSETHRVNTILESEGSYPIMAFLQFKNNSEFREFEEKFLKRFQDSIQDYSFEIAKAQHKLDWFPEALCNQFT